MPLKVCLAKFESSEPSTSLIAASLSTATESPLGLRISEKSPAITTRLVPGILTVARTWVQLFAGSPSGQSFHGVHETAGVRITLAGRPTQRLSVRSL